MKILDLNSLKYDGIHLRSTSINVDYSKQYFRLFDVIFYLWFSKNQFLSSLRNNHTGFMTILIKSTIYSVIGWDDSANNYYLEK